jgi:hypothetical protein
MVNRPYGRTNPSHGRRHEVTAEYRYPPEWRASSVMKTWQKLSSLSHFPLDEVVPPYRRPMDSRRAVHEGCSKAEFENREVTDGESDPPLKGPMGFHCTYNRG